MAFPKIRINKQASRLKYFKNRIVVFYFMCLNVLLS